MTRGRKKVVKEVVVEEVEDKNPFRIVENGGKFILYHGGSVRHVFMTRAKAEEYLKWCRG